MTVYVVLEQDGIRTEVRRVFVAADHADRFISEHDGTYFVEEMPIDTEYRRKNE